MEQYRVRPFTVILALMVAVAAAIAAYLYFHSGGEPKNSNRLLLGKKSEIKELAVNILSPVEFTGLTTESILEYRQTAIQQTPGLLASGYVPYDPIFKNIKSGSNWFSVEGFYFRGPSPESVHGPSSESRVILNPYMLLSPEFLGLSIWGEGNLQWDREKVTESELQKSNFPFTPNRHDLIWHPQARTAEITFDITDFIDSVNRYTLKPVSLAQADFAVSAYNALDLGLPLLYLDLKSSTNIQNSKQPELPVRIGDRLIYAADACGEPSGCNHRPYYISYYDTVKITALPADAVFKLWGYRATKPDDKESIKFIMHFK